MTKKHNDDKFFQFSRVFSDEPQQEVFQAIEHLVPEIF